MSDNFEKYWKDKFDSFEVEPSSSLWDKLDNSLFEKQSRSLFKDYLIQPRRNVWRKIYVALWWKQFVKFSPLTFNVYYLLFSIFTATSLALLITPTTPSENQGSHIAPSVNAVTNDNRSFHALQKPSLPAQVAYVEPTAKPIAKVTAATKKEIANDKENEQEAIAALSALSSGFLVNQQAEVKSPLYVQNSYAFLPAYRHSISLYVAPVIQQHSFRFDFNETFNNISHFKLLSSESYAVSVWYQQQKHKLSWQCGLLFQSSKQYFEYHQARFTTDTILNYTINDNSYYQYSYIQILNLDSLLLTGDTVWITYVSDSTLVADIDTLISYEYKHRRENHTATHYFSYKTVEIPFMMGYHESFGRFDIGFKAGLSLGYILVLSGAMPSIVQDYGTTSLTRKQCNLFHLNALAGMEARYHLTERWAVSVMPLYKQNLFNLMSSEIPVKMNSRSWIVQLGLTYSFK